MSGVGGRNKSKPGVVMGLVPLQLPVVVTPAALAAPAARSCDLVAPALLNQPDVIFADEPTGNLDSAASQDMHRLIRQLRDDYRQTFVIVTHNKELADLSDRCLEMKDGLLV